MKKIRRFDLPSYKYKILPLSYFHQDRGLCSAIFVERLNDATLRQDSNELIKIIAFEAEIVETTFVSSCFYDNQKKQLPSQSLPKRNNKKPVSFLVVSAQNRLETKRHDQKQKK